MTGSNGISPLESDSAERPVVVGLGASAGGLEAFRKFLQAIPPDTGMSFVLAPHLHPTQKSLMAELLGQHTRMPVAEASDKMRILSNHVYVIPPNAFLEVLDGELRLTMLRELRGRRTTVDQLFRSIARNKWCLPIGIVLSGTGNDGTTGLLAIRDAGGLAIAQEPSTAAHSQMPQSAIDAGAVDLTLEIEEIPEALTQFVRHPLVGTDRSISTEEAALRLSQRLEELMRDEEGFQLDQYKPGTIMRRLSRRMGLAAMTTPEEYIGLLKRDPEERRQLIQDLLIGVTEFFRDQEAFELLRGRILDDLVSELPSGESIRSWIPACATGEEAYSIAMILSEACRAIDRHHRLQIFATDVDEEAIQVARKGNYDANIVKQIPPSLLQDYFSPIDNSAYVVRSPLRDLISFAIHNVCSDPPFPKLHLISCRNALIYFRPEAQERVLRMFHFALQPGGILFLGSAESLGVVDEWFEPLSTKWRIFRRREGTSSVKQSFVNTIRPYPLSRLPRQRTLATAKTSHQFIQGQLLTRWVPPSVVIDGNDQAIYFHGDLSEYLQLPQGHVRLDLFEMLLPHLRIRIQSALFKGRREQREIEVECPAIEGRETRTRVTIRPLGDDDQTTSYAMVSFISAQLDDTDESSPKETISDRMIHELERELDAVRTDLQHTVEELEISNQEIKDSHEIALTTNEELQATNEELESTSEELRSLNEELITVNAQLREKMDQVRTAHDDLSNLISSTNLATVFLDKTLQIQRITPAAEQLLGLSGEDLGSRIREISHPMLGDGLENELQSVINQSTPIRHELQDSRGRWLVRTVLPYQTENHRVDGVVITFNDVTELREATERSRKEEQRRGVVAQLSQQALAQSDPVNLIELSVRMVAQVLDVDSCFVMELSEAGDRLELTSSIETTPYSHQFTEVPLDLSTLSGCAFQSQFPVIVEDFERDNRFPQRCPSRSQQAVSAICVAIQSTEGPRGVIGASTRSYRLFDSDEAHFLSAVSSVIEGAVRRYRAEHEAEVSSKRLLVALSAAEIGTWRIDLNTNQATRHENLNRLMGLEDTDTTHQLEGFLNRVHPEDHDRVFQSITQAIDRSAPYQEQYRLLRDDGTILWARDQGLVVTEESGQRVMTGALADITLFKETSDSLIRHKELLQIALEGGQLGTWYCDLSQGFSSLICFDDYCRNVYGVPAEASIDQMLDAVHPDDRDLVSKKIRAVLDQSAPNTYSFEHRMIGTDGTTRWIAVRGRRRPEASDPERGSALLTGAILDITDRKRAELVLREEAKRKDEFLAMLAHELRNPLATASLATQHLQLGADEDERSELVEMIHEQLQNVAKLVDDLLDAGRIKHGKVRLRFEPIRPIEAVERATAGVAESIRIHQHQLVIQVENDLPVIIADRLRLEQILSNLLANAAKYTPDGGRIELSAQSEGAEIHFSVRDNGIGMAPELLERVFEIFEQGDRTLARSEGGLGIGLTLVHSLVKHHGGRVTASSPGPGQGSEFVVTLPLQPQEDSGKHEFEHRTPNEPTESACSESTGETQDGESGQRILLVDDNTEMVNVLSRLLESQGFLVRTAADGEAALELARHYLPDIVLLDIGLPKLDGFEVAQRLQTDPNSAPRTLIALSGYGQQHDRERSRDAGFDHHLEKPVDLEDLLTLLDSRTNEKERQTHPESEIS